MNWRPAAGLAVGVVIVGWAVSKGCSRSGERELVELPPQELEFEVPAQGDLTGSAGTTITLKPGEAIGRDITPPTATVIPAKAEMPFEYQKELDLFNDIRKRLFLSEADLAEKNRLLRDTALLRAMGLRLTEASVSQAIVESQDVAVDLLVEALKSGDKAAASDVMKTIVQDAQIENPTLDSTVRSNMAGIKGEIMLRWAALVPEDAANIERSLPGPISKKIWQNVKKRHDSNLSE